MRFDTDTLAPGQGYKLLVSTLTPRPIAWVTSQDATGRVNCAPYSFFNGMGGNPPVIALGVQARGADGVKDTLANIRAMGEFVVNLVTEELAPQMNLTCVDCPPDVSEVELAGLRLAPSEHVAVPGLADSPVRYECAVQSIVDTGVAQAVIIARVLAFHIADPLILDAGRCYIDGAAVGGIGRMYGSGVYTRTTDRFEMARPAWPLEVSKG